MSAFSKENAEQMQAYYASATLPTGAVQLSADAIIFDVPKFIKAHLQVILKNAGVECFNPYYNRLLALKKMMDSNTVAAVDYKPVKYKAAPMQPAAQQKNLTKKKKK